MVSSAGVVMETSCGMLIQAGAFLQKVPNASFMKLRMTIFKLFDGSLTYLRRYDRGQ